MSSGSGRRSVGTHSRVKNRCRVPSRYAVKLFPANISRRRPALNPVSSNNSRRAQSSADSLSRAVPPGNEYAVRARPWRYSRVRIISFSFVTARIAADVPRCMRIQCLRAPLGNTTSSSEMGGHVSRIRFVATTRGSDAVEFTGGGRVRRPNYLAPSQEAELHGPTRGAQLLLRATRVCARDAPQVLEEGQAREGEGREGGRERGEGKDAGEARPRGEGQGRGTRGKESGSEETGDESASASAAAG